MSKIQKKGSTSFYVVIFSTLLLTVIIVSLSILAVRENTKSIENSLAQSAYDSALAGVEDAKLAMAEYYSCANNNKTLTSGLSCENIKTLINSSSQEWKSSSPCSTDAVTKILQRNGDNVGGEVMIKETEKGDSTTIQAYTCVQVSTTSSDYRGSINQSSPVKTIPLFKYIDPESISYIKIYWYSAANREKNTSILGLDINESSTAKPVTFRPFDESIPPVLQFSFFQTSSSFYLNELDADKTYSRGTVWLVPANSKYLSTSIATSEVSANTLLDSYNHSKENSPVIIDCPIDNNNNDNEFLCSAKINLPSIANRSSENFFATVSLPYNYPETDFAVEMYNRNDQQMPFKDAQIIVDSTGRANDVYSRVEARLEYQDIYFPFPEYVINLSGAGSGEASLLKSI